MVVVLGRWTFIRLCALRLCCVALWFIKTKISGLGLKAAACWCDLEDYPRTVRFGSSKMQTFLKCFETACSFHLVDLILSFMYVLTLVL